MGERNVGESLSVLVAVLLLAGGGLAATYHFSLEGSVTVEENDVTVSQQSFTTTASQDSIVVEEFEVENAGNGTRLYFEEVVEGPDPDNVSVSFHRRNSTESIYSSDKLRVPAGTEESPVTVQVNAHVEVEEDAEPGEYDVFIQAKETG